MTENKAQAAAREIAEELLKDWEVDPRNVDKEGDLLYWIGVSGFIDFMKRAAERAYAQGQRDLLEAARGKAIPMSDSDKELSGEVVFVSDLESLVKGE